MSLDDKVCRVCLQAQTTSKFNQIFDNNGKIGKQIYELCGLKILEFKQCPALICPKCTENLLKAIELRNSILDNNRHFNEIYKLCRFEEYDIDFPADSSQWPVQDIKSEAMSFSDYTISNAVDNYHSLETQGFIITEVKQEPEFTENPSTDPMDIKEEPEEIQNYEFNYNPSDDLDNCDNYLDEISQSTSQYSSEPVHYPKRRPLSPGQLERKRERDRLRKQEKRSNETAEEREARKQANAARQRRRREMLKDERLKTKVRSVIRRRDETEEQRQKRLESERIRMAERRKTETEAERQKRLAAERARVAHKRRTESEEARRKRLEEQRIRVAQRRSAERTKRN
ncbi:uncharacterized protein [Chironomus tepperi]|uniref:uncharacterized protein n=1 Tax=Chironomus tepperi TaxID=113505 RepID=UPI00391EE519